MIIVGIFANVSTLLTMVGPPNNPLMLGGADQILLPQHYDESWITQILNIETGQVYTLEEFKTLFPNQ